MAQCRVPKINIPEFIPVSPIKLTCPRCAAKPGKDCESPSGFYLPLVHVQRIKAAAKADILAKKARTIHKPSSKPT